VLNTSGIGWLDGFTWQPSTGWKVTGIKASAGATCSVTSAGKIHCASSIKPTTCLYTGDGCTATVTFTASPASKKSATARRHAVAVQDHQDDACPLHHRRQH
jgi:hypothetical protein